jgi:hypothetical protein
MDNSRQHASRALQAIKETFEELKVLSRQLQSLQTFLAKAANGVG